LEKAADYIVDFRGAIKPLTFLKLTHVFRGMKRGEVLRIVGLDPDTRKDLLKVLPALSYESVLEEEPDGEFCSIQIKKKDSKSHPYLHEKE
jgi:TusA-related sulfurtransferase